MRLVPGVAVALSLAVPVRAQHAPAPTTLEAYNKARTLIEAAVNAHGGIDALRELRTASVKIVGWDFHPTQGRRVASGTAPLDSTVRTTELMIDLERGHVVSTGTNGWPGGFLYTTRFVTRGDSTFAIRPRDHNYSIVAGAARPEQQYGNLAAIPHFYLLGAWDNFNPSTRRYLGRMRLPSGVEVEAVHFMLPPQGNSIIGLDPRTHQLRSLMSVGPDVFTGDTEVVTEFLDWRMIDGVQLPSRVTLTRGGFRVREMRYVAASKGQRIPDSLLTVPRGFTAFPATPPAPAVQELAPGIRLVGSGSKSLVVEFNDHLVVVDAPSSTSAETITSAAQFAPDKPIRFVVPTHHHDDHFMGVRYHGAAGSTIVTTPGNVSYLRRIMTAPTSTLMQARNQVAPSSSYKSETMTGTRVFSDGSRTLEIHEIDSPHAEGMLVAWLPNEGILYQADLIDAGGGLVWRGANAAATMHLADFIRRKGWNVRTFAGTHSTLQRPELFAELTQLPLVPPEH
jgi:glyoxylase-like metal-dependent hydrolase (beta-lactamase superfamily II)